MFTNSLEFTLLCVSLCVTIYLSICLQVKNASIKEGLVGPGSSTFIVVDFFDYESQTTALMSGCKPAWDFGAVYKIIVDDFLMRYLAVDVVTLELNMVRVSV